jgi:hypothetical protein
MRVPKVGDLVRIKPNNRTYPENMWGLTGTVIIVNGDEFKFDVPYNDRGYCHLGMRATDHYELLDRQLILPFGADHV